MRVIIWRQNNYY